MFLTLVSSAAGHVSTPSRASLRAGVASVAAGEAPSTSAGSAQVLLVSSFGNLAPLEGLSMKSMGACSRATFSAFARSLSRASIVAWSSLTALDGSDPLWPTAVVLVGSPEAVCA